VLTYPDANARAWQTYYFQGPRDICDTYRKCGAFGPCDAGAAPTHRRRLQREVPRQLLVLGLRRRGPDIMGGDVRSGSARAEPARCRGLAAVRWPRTRTSAPAPTRGAPPAPLAAPSRRTMPSPLAPSWHAPRPPAVVLPQIAVVLPESPR